MRKFYAVAKEAQDVNAPDANTVVDEIEPLFEGQGSKPDNEHEDDNPNL